MSQLMYCGRHWSGTPYPSYDDYGPIEACKVLTVLSGSRPHRSGTSQRYAHPTQATDLARAVSCPEGQGSSVSARRTQTSRPGSESAPAKGPLAGSAVPVTPSHEPVVAAEHMSDGRTRARRTFPGQPRCALRARLSDEPDGRGTNGLRDRRSASRSESGMELTPLA